MILTVESSTMLEMVAVVSDGAVLSEERSLAGAGHAERLMRGVDSVLSSSGTTIPDLEAIAISIGPGSFSGLRVGLATVKGLAVRWRVPVAPVPTLAALARSAPSERGLVCPLLDARRGEVYGALFRAEPPFERIIEELALPPLTLVERVREKAGTEQICFLGTGATTYSLEIEAALGAQAQFPDAEVPAPSAGALYCIAREQIERGLTRGIAELEPLYLRGP